MCVQENQLMLHPALGAKQTVGFRNLLRPKPLFVADGKCHTTWKKHCHLTVTSLPPALHLDRPLIVASVPMNITWKTGWHGVRLSIATN